MKEKPDKINRRDFLRTVGAAGLGGSIALTAAAADANEKTTDPNAPPQIQKIILPTRTLGKTGVKVPILALGMMFDALEKQIVLRKALQLGVTYWDTAYSYGGEKSLKQKLYCPCPKCEHLNQIGRASCRERV